MISKSSSIQSIWDIDLKTNAGLEKLEIFLSNGGNADEIGDPFQDASPATLLIKASFWGYVKAAEILIQFGANVNYVNPRVGSPLINAAGAGELELCTILLHHGADANLSRISDIFPAISYPHVISTPLSQAAKYNHEKIIELLLEYGAETDIVVESIPVIGDIITPLSIAARRGNLSAVNSLLNGGANINFMHPIGFSPLHESIVNNHIKIFRLLIDNGADIHQRGSIYGATPLWLAKRVGSRMPSQENQEIQDYLTNNGAVSRLYLWANVLLLSGFLNFR
ncbi:MAG: ankyrin repeat domain-containing protein [Elainellaceae cyanobacterium]